MTIKQKKFVKEYIKTGNGYQSAVKAGYKCNSRTTYDVIASENIRKPYIALAIKDALDKAGLNNLNVSKRHKLIIFKGKDADSISAIKLYHQLAGNLIERKESKNLSFNINKDLDKMTQQEKLELLNL